MKTDRPSVIVFTPAPILTVTIEPGAGGEGELHVHAGGQGVWIARMLHRLRVRAVLCAPIGGEIGAVLRNRLEGERLHIEGVPVRATNGFYVHDRRSGERLEIAARHGSPLGRHEADDLYARAFVASLDAGTTVLAGQPYPGAVPMEVYCRLSRDLRANGCRVVGDLSGEPLVRALEGGLDLLKISHEEAIADGWAIGSGHDDLVAAVRDLHERGARTVVLSRAAEPALVATADHFWEIVLPRVEPVDFRGTGDSMTAGLAAGLATGLPLPAILRLAAAAGSLNATRRGLGTGSLREIHRLARHVVLRPLMPGR